MCCCCGKCCCKCSDCCSNITNHSTSYLVIITSYAVSLYELWKSSGKEKNYENIVTMIFLLIPHIFGILEINGIQILKFLSFKCDVLKSKQKNLISDLKEIYEILSKSKENKKFINDFFHLINEISKMRNEIADSDKGGNRRGKKGKRKKGKGKKGKNKNN